ncbi:MAG: Rrf2 family transcriptional regulator [Oscillospiraceae bacterium]|nr:Rrf2 family transcriptional regulator [Oscillospiraceae bacterium]
MKISTRGRYALRMLLDLAENKDKGFISLREIAERQDISKQYLEHIISLLHTSNILLSNRGKKGGHMLAKSPSEYTVGQVLRITEGSLAPVSCLKDTKNQCDRAGFCKTLPMWTGFDKVINEYFDGITLQDMLEQYNDQNAEKHTI